METTRGTLLDGRVEYHQPRHGWRTGIEPVLLAAWIPARTGERVLEAGTGAGAGLLCLLARVPGVLASGIELDAGMAQLARDNLVRNGLAGCVHTADVAEAARFGPVEQVFCNPPWHDPAGTPPAGPLRVLAKQLPAGGLGAWVTPLAAALTPEGTLSLAVPAALAAAATAALGGAGLGQVLVLPLHPRAGVAPKIVLVRGRRGPVSQGVGPGLVLHEPGGAYTPEADAVLRGGAALRDVIGGSGTAARTR